MVRVPTFIRCMLVTFVVMMPLPSFGTSAAKAKLWPAGETLNVCFFGGTPDLRAEIVKIASAWSGIGSIAFDFGQAPSYRVCNQAEKSHVRVAFRNLGAWSFLGTDSTNVASQDEPSLNIPPDRLQSEISSSIVLRLFGQALALRSDFFSDPKCVAEIKLNSVDAAVRIEFNHDDALSLVTPFVRLSALNPAIVSELFSSGDRSPCYVESSAQLTQADIAGLRAIYPKYKAPGPTATTNVSLRILANKDLGVDQIFLEAAWAWDEKNTGDALSSKLRSIQAKLESVLDQLRVNPPTQEIRTIIEKNDQGEFAEALKLATVVGQKGQAAAYLIVAYYNTKDIGSPSDEVEVARWTRAAAEKDEPIANYLLGYCYELGIGVAKNAVQAVHYYNKAAKSVPLASERLARLYLTDTGSNRNTEKALEQYRIAAAAGLNSSIRSLAFLLDQGIGGLASKTDALVLAEKAAAADDAPAMLLMGLLHFEGVTPASTSQIAIGAVTQSANKSFRLGKGLLVYLYEIGWVDGKPNSTRAIELYREAADDTLPSIQRRLAERLRQGSSSDAKQMLALLQSAASHGDLQAQLILSNLYRSGMEKTDPSGEQYVIKADPTTSTLWRILASVYAPPQERKQIIDQAAPLIATLNPREWVGAHEPAVTWIRRREHLDHLTSAIDRGARSDTPNLRVKSQGSGVVISRERHVLTNFHVVDGCSRVGAKIDDADGQLTDLRQDVTLDVAIGRLSWLPANNAALREELPANNPPVLVVGYPDTDVLGQGLEVWPGSITGYEGIGGNTARFRVTATTNPGKSGGGVFDSAGNLIGISVSRAGAALEAQSGIKNINIAIKSDAIGSALRTWNIKYEKADPKANPLDPNALTEQAKQTAVLLTCYD